MQSRPVDEARRAEFQRIMIDDCDRLLHTIEQVLRAGQSGSSSKRIRGTELDLGQTVRECVELARTRHHLDSDALRYNPADGDASVMGDVHEIRTAVSNLIDNAVKYSGGKVDVLVELLPGADGSWLVRVADRGIGIPRAELRRIFKRFYRIPGVAGRVKGMGLGLFIVNAVAKRHGGKVFADSAGQGEGSTFTLQLPAAGGGR
jgi:signal transduction histidine kinase